MNIGIVLLLILLAVGAGIYFLSRKSSSALPGPMRPPVAPVIPPGGQTLGAIFAQARGSMDDLQALLNLGKITNEQYMAYGRPFVFEFTPLYNSEILPSDARQINTGVAPSLWPASAALIAITARFTANVEQAKQLPPPATPAGRVDLAQQAELDAQAQKLPPSPNNG